MVSRSIPAPPLDAFRPSKISPAHVALALLLILIVLVGGYEIAVLHADFTRVLRHELETNPRVRADFGEHVRIPLGVAWGFGGAATVYAEVEGTEATGYVVADMVRTNGEWKFARLEVHNQVEDHIVNLSPPPPVAGIDQLHGTGRIYLVALGDSASQEVDNLARFLHDESGVPAQVLPVIALPPQARDARRNQWVGEMLIDAMAASNPDLAADPEAKIIGIIDDDLYPRTLGWRFAYNFREFQKYAVIPTVRVNPVFYKKKRNDAITTDRLQKIALKIVGLFYFGFQETNNPASVMLWDHTPAAMDRMSGKYLLSDVATQTRTDNTTGEPCLTFSSVNVGGAPKARPIEVCSDPGNISESTDYEIDLATGEARFGRNDLYRSGPMRFFLRRMYFSHAYDSKIRAFGKGTWNNLDDTLWSTDPRSIQTVRAKGVDFSRITPGVGFSPTARYRAPGNEGDFSNAVLSWERGHWRIDGENGEVWHYLGCGPDTPVPCYFMDETGRHGDRMWVTRNGSGNIEQAVQKTAADLPSAAALDHVWSFTYDGQTITRIRDSDGRSATYAYDADHELTDVEADGHKLHYAYDGSHRMNLVVEDGRALRIHYDSEGRVDEVAFPDRSSYRIRYSGEAVEVTGRGASWRVKIRDRYFETSH